MDYGDAPPTADEISAAAKPSAKGAGLKYADAPPTADELGEVAPDAMSGAKRLGITALQGLGKAAGTLRALTTGPLTGSIIEAATGKPVYHMSDVGNAVNPTNLKTFPTNEEMFKKAGIANPELSDALPSIYAKPGTKHPWYQPEKGGMLDPSLAGTLQMGSDPAMWVGAGEEGAAAKILAENANKTSLLNKLSTAVSAPVRAGGKALGTVSGAKAVSKAFDWGAGKLGDAIPVLGGVERPAELAAQTLVNPISAATKGLGKVLYGSPLLPVAQEGEKFGKRGITDDLYAAGIKTPIHLHEKVGQAAGALGDEADRLIQGAGNTAADIDTMVARAQAEVDNLRKVRDPDADSLADHLQSKIDGYRAQAAGKPGVPGTPSTTQQTPILNPQGQPLLDASGSPLTKQTQIPGSPGVPATPPHPFTAEDTDALKKYYYRKGTASTWKQGAPIRDEEQRFDKAMGLGSKEATEDAVDAASGAGADLQDIQRARGGMLSTQTGQQTVGRQADRNLHNIVAPTGIDRILAILGGENGGGLRNVLANKLGYAVHFGTMPTGYALRKLGETNVLDRLNELSTRNQEKK